MRTMKPEIFDTDEREGASIDAFEIAVELPWCVIRISLPRHWHETSLARRRSPAMAEPSPGAAARARAHRPSAANGWRG